MGMAGVPYVASLDNANLEVKMSRGAGAREHVERQAQV